MQSAFQSIAVLLGLAALFGYLNHRLLKLPATIGLVIIALAASLGVLAIDAVSPNWHFGDALRGLMDDIDFNAVLMQGMLSFLLFAGALHVDLEELTKKKWSILAMASLGVVLSTLMIGYAMWFVFTWLGLSVPLVYCLVFGALISPTDPIAVLGILKGLEVPTSLRIKIAGESLFNDGVGVVVFGVILAIAVGGNGEAMSAGGVALLFVQEAVGGALLGLVGGLIAFYAMRSIDEHNLEVIITLALVTVTYAIAMALHTSGPIAMVIAGLLIGNHGTRHAMTEKTREHLHNFWSLLDEILNAVLFLLIGLEVVHLAFSTSYAWATLAAIPIVLAARLVAVAVPLQTLSLWLDYTRGAVPVLAWGGLRGGISVALALSLPPSDTRDLLLTVTYGVVIFSIVVQGLSIEALIKRVVKANPAERT